MLDFKFRGIESATTADQMRTRMASTLSVIGALHQAGMTAMEMIESATIVSACAMHLDKTVGTIESGKRADLILVGDPLKDIVALRKVTRVVTNGRIYDRAALWKSIGFRQ